MFDPLNNDDCRVRYSGSDFKALKKMSDQLAAYWYRNNQLMANSDKL